MPVVKGDDVFSDEEDEIIPSSGETSDELKIKTYPVDLPNNGRLSYPETVWYRDIMVRDEKIFASATNENYGRVLTSILKSLLKGSDGYFEKLTIYDRDFLLLWVWANNYSTVKKFDVQCPVCDTKNKFEVDVTKLPIDHLDDEYEEPFEMELENGDIVKLRLFNIKDEQIAENYIKRNPESSESYIMLINAMQFETVLPLQQKIDYVESKMSGKDMAMVRAFHKHFKYGINDVVDYNCPECSEVTPFKVPFSAEFFYPVMDNDFEDLLRSNKRAKNKSNGSGSTSKTRSKRSNKKSQ